MPGWIKAVETKAQTIINDWHIVKIWIDETDASYLVMAELTNGEEVRMHEGTYEECQRWLEPFYPYSIDNNNPAR